MFNFILIGQDIFAFQGSDPKLQKPSKIFADTLYLRLQSRTVPNRPSYTRGIVSLICSRLLIEGTSISRKWMRFGWFGQLPPFPFAKILGWRQTRGCRWDKIWFGEQNLMAEYHIRYSGYGGIAYHHVSNLYVALFSHLLIAELGRRFILLMDLLKNESKIQPDILNTDTGTIRPFWFVILLGIELQPRIKEILRFKFLSGR